MLTIPSEAAVAEGSHTRWGRFYLDMEFTNGNYYLVDILETALLAEESGNVYHSYVKINYSVPQQVKLLTGITNRTIETRVVPLRDVMDGRRQRAHGVFVHDFPILLASCMKHNYNDYTVLAELVYVDSMQNLKGAGYRRPGLDALCSELEI